MTTNQILIGVGLILVLAVGAQVLASRLRIPALIVLLPAGFIAGALTTDVNPERLLGPAFEPLVSLSVAVILYDAGLGLDLRKLKGHVRKVVIRLIILGVLITWVLAASVAAPLLGMSRGAAVMLGIILVVSGPTVVGPLLRFVRPAERLQQVLIWEGSLIDPVGGILGALVFHAVISSTHKGPGNQLGQFAVSVLVGLAGGVIGTALLWLLLRKLRLGELLGTTAQLAAVIGVAAGCDVARAGRYHDGARIVVQPANGVLPAGHDLLFIVRADGQLAAVTQTGTPAPEAGDTIVSLGPVPVAQSIDRLRRP